jgi:hypothetical protein
LFKVTKKEPSAYMYRDTQIKRPDPPGCGRGQGKKPCSATKLMLWNPKKCKPDGRMQWDKSDKSDWIF